MGVAEEEKIMIDNGWIKKQARYHTGCEPENDSSPLCSACDEEGPEVTYVFSDLEDRRTQIARFHIRCERIWKEESAKMESN